MGKSKPFINKLDNGEMEAGFIDENGMFNKECDVTCNTDIDEFLSRHDLFVVMIGKWNK